MRIRNVTLTIALLIVAAICIWGGPILGLIGLFGSLIQGADPARFAVGVVLGAYFAIGGLLIGGVLHLLLSIDDRLERLEGTR